jgi:hypothetical protein
MYVCNIIPREPRNDIRPTTNKIPEKDSTKNQ